MATVFEIFLKSVLVIENGKIEENVEGVNTLSVTLIYPSPGVPYVMSTRPLQLEDNVDYIYRSESLQDHMMFKEVIAGDSALEVEITAIERPGKIEKALHNLLGSALPKAASLIPGAGSLVTTAIKAASRSLVAMSEPKEKISVLGRGGLPIDEGTPDGELAIQLQVPERIVLKKVKFDAAGNEIHTTKTLEAGYVNGQVIFEIKRV